MIKTKLYFKNIGDNNVKEIIKDRFKKYFELRGRSWVDASDLEDIFEEILTNIVASNLHGTISNSDDGDIAYYPTYMMYKQYLWIRFQDNYKLRFEWTIEYSGDLDKYIITEIEVYEGSK